MCYGARAMPKTLHFDSTTQRDDILDGVKRALEEMDLEDGPLSVSIVGDSETMSPQQAADFLGISRQHMTRLLEAGVLPFTRKPSSTHRVIASRAVVEFAGRRAEGKRRWDEFAATMNDAGVFE
jgi:excisionase family DNA binding protein